MRGQWRLLLHRCREQSTSLRRRCYFFPQVLYYSTPPTSHSYHHRHRQGPLSSLSHARTTPLTGEKYRDFHQIIPSADAFWRKLGSTQITSGSDLVLEGLKKKVLSVVCEEIDELGKKLRELIFRFSSDLVDLQATPAAAFMCFRPIDEWHLFKHGTKICNALARSSALEDELINRLWAVYKMMSPGYQMQECLYHRVSEDFISSNVSRDAADFYRFPAVGKENFATSPPNLKINSRSLKFLDGSGSLLALRLTQKTRLYHSAAFTKEMRRVVGKTSVKRNKRDHKRRLLAAKYELRRNLYKALCMDSSLPSDMREKFRYKLSKLPRNSAFSRVRNRCIFTGRPRGVYRTFRMSRIVFRDLASRGALMGIKKASW